MQQTGVSKETPQSRILQEKDSQTSASWSPLRDTAVLERGQKDQLRLDTFKEANGLEPVAELEQNQGGCACGCIEFYSVGAYTVKN